MWPWKKRIEIVNPEDAGDDAIAALTMILRYYQKSVTVQEVEQAIYQSSTSGVPTALNLIAAGEHFGLQGKALGLQDERHLDQIPTPNIAHMSLNPGRLPRQLPLPLDNCYFAVVSSISTRRVCWVDPYLGNLDEARAEFAARASGVFLIFAQRDSLPVAKARATRA